MYLVIDQGNTYSKIAVFYNEKIVLSKVFTNNEIPEIGNVLTDIDKVYAGGKITHAIISSVISNNSLIIDSIKSITNLIELDHNTPIPLENKYDTRETLGKDRLAASVGAACLYPDTNILVIDAGTCITYDFIKNGKEYWGGGISPGLEMRFKAMNTFTAKLPLVTFNEHVSLTGRSTEDSIRSGVQNGIQFEIEGFITRYKMLYPGLKTVITGGDSKYFVKKIKNNIFAVPNLVLLGLKDILKHNVEK